MQDACHMDFVISLVGAYIRTLGLGVRTTDRLATANISPPHSVLETKKLQEKVLDSTFPTIFKFVNNCRIRTLMGFEL